MFYTTAIPVSLWFLTRDKSGKNLKRAGGGRDRKGETLFIDARKLGTMQSRTLRVLTGADKGETVNGEHGPADGNGDPLADSDIGRMIYKYRQWRGEPAPKWWNPKTHGAWKYEDVPGFCKKTKLADIEKHGFVLTPGRFVGAEAQEEDAEPFAEKFPRLVSELDVILEDGERLTALVRARLAEVSGNA